MIYSDDHGRTWKTGQTTREEVEGGPDGKECMATELSDGRVYLTIRNNTAKDGRAHASSDDGGETWSRAKLEGAVPEPVCQASILGYPIEGGKSLQVYLAPSRTAKNRRDKKARRDLRFFVSTDDGKTWQTSDMILKGPAAYSDLALMPDSTVGCLFEAGEQRYDEKLPLQEAECRLCRAQEARTTSGLGHWRRASSALSNLTIRRSSRKEGRIRDCGTAMAQEPLSYGKLTGRSTACISCRCRMGRDRCGRLSGRCGRVWLSPRLPRLR